MKEIFKGWTRTLLKQNTQEAKRKAKICINCEFIEKGKYEFIKDDEIKEAEGAVCGICKCPLIPKLRSDDKCPKGKF